MGRRVRIPGLVDLLMVDSPGEIRAVADDPALVRGRPGFGPLLNRMIHGNVWRALNTGREPLPSVLPRDDAGRAAAQSRLADRLSPETAPWDDGALAAIARYLHGSRARPLGPLCQEAVGRLFVPGYRATRATWRAAEVVDSAARSMNPLRRLYWWLTSAVGRAQRTLADAVEGDASGVHATGIAVHSFMRSVQRLEKALSDPVARRTLSTEAVLGSAVSAPQAVLRRAVAHADTAAGRVAPGTLVLLQTEAATRLTDDPRVAFMSESWSFCPAHHAVPAMLAGIWRHATGETLERAQVQSQEVA